MPRGAIEKAFIEIEADASGFDASLQAGTSKALGTLANKLRQVFSSFDEQASSAVRSISGQIFSLSGNVAKASAPMDSLARGLDRVYEQASRLDEPPRVIQQAVAQVAREYQKFSSLLVSQPRKALNRSEADFEQFATQIRASLGRAIVGGVDQIEESLTDLSSTGERQFKALDAVIDDTFAGLGDVEGLERLRGRFTSLTDAVKDDYAEALDAAESSLSNLAASGTTDLDTLRGTAAQLGVDLSRFLSESIQEVIQELKLVSGGAEAFEDVAEAARRTGQESVEALADIKEEIIELRSGAETLDDAFAQALQGIREAAGRAAVGGIDQVTESITDLRQTGVREIDKLEEAIESSLSHLDTDELERLRPLFRDLANQVRGDFLTSVEKAGDALSSMPTEGKENIRDFQRAVALTSDTLTDDLERSLDGVRRSLKLVEGDAEAFNQLGAEGRQAANLLDAAFDEAEDEARQLREQIERTGEEALRAGRRGQSGFGRFVAAMNRVRFLALDARFIIGGIGAFAAAQFARFGVEAASSIEQARLSFQVIARSIEGEVGDSFENFRDTATDSLETVIEFARDTPFSLEQVADGVRKIAAFLPSLGVASEKALGTLEGRTNASIELFEDLGGALAVLGQQDAMDRLIKGLGDVGAAGKLTGEDLRQLRNALPGIEIRTAIIKGIFDPTVEATDSIRFLRSQFTELGADAENAPQKALGAFVEFQRKGLITTDVVVQGLRASLNQLAGDDALQAFTLTIDGMLEKLREAAEVGSERGFRDLGPRLIEQVLPALEQVERGSENFAAALTRLAADVVPFALDSFSGLTSLAAKVFDEIGQAVRNGAPEIRETMESFGEAGDLLAESLGAIIEAALPFGPVVGDLLVAALSAAVPLLEALVPVAENFATALEGIGPGAIIAYGALIKLSGPLEHLLKTIDKVGTKKTFSAIGGNILKMVNPITAVIAAVGGAALFKGFLDQRDINRLEDASDAISELKDSFLDLDDRVGFSGFQEGVGDAIEGLEARRDQLSLIVDNYRETITDLSLSIEGAGSLTFNDPNFSAISGAFDEMDRLRREGQALTPELENLERIFNSTLPASLDVFRDGLVKANSSLTPVQKATLLTDENLVKLANSLGISQEEFLNLAEQGPDALGEALLRAADGGDGLRGQLQDVGIAAGKVDLSKAVQQGDNVKEAFEDAAAEVVNLGNKLRARNDPVFAVLEARASFFEDLAEFENFEVGEDGTREEKIALGVEVNQSSLEVLGKVSDLVGAISDPEVGASFDQTMSDVGSALEDLDIPASQARELMDLLGVEIKDAAELGASAMGPDGLLTTNVKGGAKIWGDAFEGGRKRALREMRLLAEGADKSGERLGTGIEKGAGKAKKAAQDLSVNFAVESRKITNAAQRTRERAGRHFSGMGEDVSNFRSKAVSETNLFAVGVFDEVQALANTAPNETERMTAAMEGQFFDLEGAATTSGRNTADNFIAPLQALEARAAAAGANAVSGLVSGLGSSAAHAAAASAAAGLANTAVRAMEGGFQIESPSKRTMKIGDLAVDGLLIPFRDRVSEAQAAGKGLAKAVQGGVSDLSLPGGAPGFTGATSASSPTVGSMTVVSPSPRAAARQVVNQIGETVYLNTGVRP